jgi:hypothetical protein
MKLCKSCNTKKPETSDHFAKNKQGKNGLRSKCKECQKTYAKRWNKDNPEKLKAYSKAHDHKNREKRREKDRAYYRENREKILLDKKKDTGTPAKKKRDNEYYHANKERILQLKKTIRDADPDSYRKKARQYYHENKHKCAARANAKSAARRAAKRKATPEWANIDKIREIYKESSRKTLETGIQYHVDHVIPLNNPLVCGLHVHENLQVITERKNLTKSNKWKP